MLTFFILTSIFSSLALITIAFTVSYLTIAVLNEVIDKVVTQLYLDDKIDSMHGYFTGVIKKNEGNITKVSLIKNNKEIANIDIIGDRDPYQVYKGKMISKTL